MRNLQSSQQRKLNKQISQQSKQSSQQRKLNKQMTKWQLLNQMAKILPL